MMLQDNHKLVAGPLPFVKIAPGKYCVIANPIDKRCARSVTLPTVPLVSSFVVCLFFSKPLGKEGKRFELKFGHREVRLHGVSESDKEQERMGENKQQSNCFGKEVPGLLKLVFGIVLLSYAFRSTVILLLCCALE